MMTFLTTSKNIRTIAVLALTLLFIGTAAAAPRGRNVFGPNYGGMMGGGMMGGGYGCGSPSGYYGFPQGDRIGMTEAKAFLADFIRYNRLSGIEIGEVMEFEHNFYAQLRETGSGMGALEVLVDPFSGYVSPEPGPNMMWNSKYGHMRGWGRGFVSGNSFLLLVSL